ncbi:DNA-binding transcriptional LysR family regulator [Serratia fonticola]|uniref:DNA-binding transcriptional LysR family regulator n=1 Tax=Serratia fonticola TaxID=47917 RepID=A0A542D2Q2_SERFO|nr:LysR family transcriptional regulator [Serratia fonticola]TQI80661.1 DNA-binding transcriptional LysR family regulator [Serratia fonticola]TQI97314.1 DNA-binding transcriptional LysR family regulator [Serratia fonticola]TVZ71810.1 DNA-binding transcriptional LysR family regulator [Serratia fonticola]
MSNFGRLDLNLLVTLDVLLVEHNVTRAAERLSLSQPSVSVHLAKLRAFFDDPLLLPGPRGMRPTARAEALREPLRQALEVLEFAVSPIRPFEPAVADITWRVAASDYGESTVLLPALAALRQSAPGSRLAVFELAPTRIARQAEVGEIDLAFHTREDAPPGMRQRVLFKEKYVLAGRAGHPALTSSPTLAQFSQLEHVVVSPNGGGFTGITDQTLEQVGLLRRVVLSVPHFLFVKSVIASTDLVAMLPERLVRGSPALQIAEPPVEIPGYEFVMLWDERSQRDPAHQWLRELIARSV